MRALFVICAALTICAAVNGVDTKAKNKLEEDVLNLLTKWRDGDKGPFSFPLPSLEEIIMPEVSGKYEGYGAKISYATSELKLTGLKNFSVEELNASKSNLTATGRITVPTLIVRADTYNIKGKALWFISVKGSGKMSITFRNNQVTFLIKLRNVGARTWVDSLQLAFKIGKVQANLENGPAAISTLMNNSGVLILQSNHEAIVSAVRAQMVPVIDAFLQDMTPNQLFRTIEGVETPPDVVQV